MVLEQEVKPPENAVLSELKCIACLTDPWHLCHRTAVQCWQWDCMYAWAGGGL